MSDGPQQYWQRPSPPGAAGSWASGAVTATGLPPLKPPSEPPAEPAKDPERAKRKQLLIFGGVAGAIVAVGLTVILILAFGSDGQPFRSKAEAPTDVRPPLAQACPAPTTVPSEEPSTAAPSAPPASGARTVDNEAGISYKQYGAPWIPWDEVWRAGTLEVPYKVGQHFVTEVYSGGSYHASILSAAVPADNDAVTLNLECVGRQVAADVRAEYYPQPNTLEQIRDGLTTLGGRPAYVSKFRLHFNEPGLSAKDELSAVAIIDVGKPTAAVLYISIPGTVKQFDYVVDEVLQSVRPV